MMMYVVESTTFSNNTVYQNDLARFLASETTLCYIYLSFPTHVRRRQKKHPALLTSMSRSFTYLGLRGC